MAGTAARRIHEVVQAPAATCGQSILAALSLKCIKRPVSRFFFLTLFRWHACFV